MIYRTPGGTAQGRNLGYGNVVITRWNRVAYLLKHAYCAVFHEKMNAIV